MNDNKRRLDILEENPSLGDAFLTAVFGSNTKSNMAVLRGAVLGGIASKELVQKLEMFVPICYKINGTIFLKGERTEHSEHSLVELFDMSTEMDTGNSSSIYVDDTSYFAYADAGETEMVKIFLSNL